MIASRLNPARFLRGQPVDLPSYRIAWLARLMYGAVFEIVVIAVIIINAVALALLTFEGLPDGVRDVARGFDGIAVAFYAVEVVLRIISYGTKPWMFFRSGWNIFDFLIVISVPFADGNAVIFRLIRLLRLIRLFRFLPEVRILMVSILKSVAPLLSISVLIGFLLFIYAMAGVYLFGDADPEQWGDLGAAMVTLIVLLTLENFPDAFTNGISVTPLALAYFLTYMFFIVFTVLNVLIGIVLNAMDQARDEEVAHQRDEADAHARANPDRELDPLQAELNELESTQRTRAERIARIRAELAELRDQ